jgi:predicted Zn-dependent protease
MQRMKARYLFPVFALGMLLANCSCDFFGVTGGLFVPEAKEVQLGRSFDSTLTNNDTAKLEYPIFQTNNDPKRIAFQNYVVNLANEVLAKVPASDRPGYDFKFTIIDKDVENAFAVPGGYVYIYTGIIKKMDDESELAGVIGHEIAHVTWHHYRDALAKTAGMGVLLDALLGDDAGQLAQLVAGSLFQLAALKVSRSNESESDHYGTLYCAAADRNPLGIAKYFAKAKDAALTWVSSHPGSGDRVNDVTSQVNASATLKAKTGAEYDYKARFLEMRAVIE